jgi:hypothetical protein
MTGAQFRELKKHRASKPAFNGNGEWVIGCSCGALSKSAGILTAEADFTAHQRVMINRLETK